MAAGTLERVSPDAAASWNASAAPAVLPLRACRRPLLTTACTDRVCAIRRLSLAMRACVNPPARVGAALAETGPASG